MALALSGNIYAQQNYTDDPEMRTLEEVIITAQKREQTLQEVPVTVSAFSGDFIEDAGARFYCACDDDIIYPLDYVQTMIQGSILVVAAVFVSINTLTDILYGFIDPRIRVS